MWYGGGYAPLTWKDNGMGTPALCVTLGDVNGVGPEILLRAWRAGDINRSMVVVGDLCALACCAEKGGYDVPLEAVDGVDACREDAVCVLDPELLSVDDIAPGSLSERTGAAALSYLHEGIRLVAGGEAGALVTLPMNKEATRLSAPEFCGHTDVIAEACGARDYTMALISDNFIVPHVSAHVSLRQALDLVTEERVYTVARLAAEAGVRLGRKVRMAVMGVNPHAGEGGAFGKEEADAVQPAVARLAGEGIDVHGPLPPDTVFMRALKGDFSVIVCMYHDQGHIPMKTIGLNDAVNVTLGLPIVRTSVDHGTAFDIAWQGIADTGSFVKACRLAEGLGGER